MEDLSTNFSAATAKELLLDKKLADKDLLAAQNPITLKADKSWPIPIDDITFSIGVGAALDIMLFNDEDDKDPDNFLAVKDSPITFNTATEACLKYAAGISAKANAQTTLAKIGFELDLSASGQAKTIYYRRHANTDSIAKAFTSDIANFRTIFKYDDIVNLATHDALAFTAGGSASCSLKIKWSDLITAGMSALTGSLPVPLTLDLDLTPTLTAEFDVTISDDFAFLVSRLPNDQCLVSVRKTRSRALSGALGASIGVAFSKPDELTTQLNEIYSKIIQSALGHTPDEILGALKKVIQNIADAAEKTLVGKALKLFKLDTIQDGADQLAKKLEDLAATIPDALKKIATASATFSFSYEYSRIEESRELLSIQTDTQHLKTYHADLLRMKLERMVSDMRNGGFPFTLLSYLNDKTLKVHTSWGFGLKAFNLTLLDGKRYTDDNDDIRTNLAGNKQVTLNRTVGYRWQIGKSQADSFGQLSATMPDFSHTLTPTLDEFDYSILLDVVTKDPNITAAELRELLDAGCAWGAVRQDDLDPLTAKHKSTLAGQAISSEIKLVIKPNQLQLIIQLIAQHGWDERNRQYMSRALAAAMGYLEGFEYRANPQAREKGYTNLWFDYLQNPGRDESENGIIAQGAFEDKGNPDNIADLEGDKGNWMQGITYAGLIHINPNLADKLKEFVLGITSLNRSIQAKARYDRFDDSCNSIKTGFGSLFLLKTVGYFLLLNADDLGLRKEIGASLTITYAGDNKITFSVI